MEEMRAALRREDERPAENLHLLREFAGAECLFLIVKEAQTASYLKDGGTIHSTDPRACCPLPSPNPLKIILRWK